MIRAIGFFVGSLLAIGLLLVVLGTPEFRRSSRTADPARIDDAIENLKRRWEDHEVPVPVVTAPADAAVARSANAGADDAVPAPEAPVEEVSVPRSVEARILADTGADAEPEWRAIWSPFRTEIAARGFVTRLESVTGLDFRVAKLRAGAYQVAFAYHDQAELDTGLAQIANATGLDLSSDLR